MFRAYNWMRRQIVNTAEPEGEHNIQEDPSEGIRTPPVELEPEVIDRVVRPEDISVNVSVGQEEIRNEEGIVGMEIERNLASSGTENQRTTDYVPMSSLSSGPAMIPSDYFRNSSTVTNSGGNSPPSSGVMSMLRGLGDFIRESVTVVGTAPNRGGNLRTGEARR